MQQNFLYSPSNYQFGAQNTNIPVSCGNQWSANEANSTPVSTSLYSTTATSSWAHTVPTLMPWMPENNSSNADSSIVRFSAPVPLDPCTSKTATQWELLNNLGAGKSSANLRLKRRMEFDDLDISQKQFITEEKMAAQMQEMHISNNYTVPLQNTSFGPTCDASKPLKTAKSLTELDSMLSQPSDLSKNIALCNHTLILSPEVKSLVEPEKLFAKMLLNQIERPTMAVVLWKPPNGCIGDIMESNNKKDDLSSHQPDQDSDNAASSSPPLSSTMQEDNNNQSFSQAFLPGTISGNVQSFYPDLHSSTDVSMEA